MDQWPTGSHGGTYSGNPLSCAAGIATMTILESQLSTVVTLGETALKKLQKGLSDLPIIRDIRGCGLMIGIEIVDEKGHPSSDITNKINYFRMPQASYACFIMWPARECASFNATAHHF